MCVSRAGLFAAYQSYLGLGYGVIESGIFKSTEALCVGFRKIDLGAILDVAVTERTLTTLAL
jgi:hypothetical protein